MKKILTIMVVVMMVFAVTFAFAADKKMPKRVGWVGNYMTHEWYQNVEKGMRDRAEQLGIELEVVDANLDMAKQVLQDEATTSDQL